MATEVITNLPSLAPASGAVDKFPLLQQPNENEKQSQIHPFINPTNAIVFREKLERQQKELLNAHSGLGYLRSTFTSRRKSFSSSWRRFALEQQDEDKKNEEPKPVCFVRDESTDKAGLQEYIQQQRQLFLIQYTSGLKENSMKGLKEAALKQQQCMIEDEKKLAKKKLAIENLMVESQTKRTQAMLWAEENANDNLLATEQIEKVTEEVLNLKSLIEKQQQELDYCITAKMFFEQLTPKERKEKRKEKMVDSDVRKEAIPPDPLAITSLNEPPSRKASTLKKKGLQLTPKLSAVSVDNSWMELRAESDLEEKPMDVKPNVSPLDQELYFKDPQEILDIFFNLEEQIVSLLQYCREVEDDIDRVNQKMAATQEAMYV
ncbi:cilia- and flagella-associated protein 100-like [Rhincodon typus]|uniref:cilia- and flagella-associated protein 100-like n=1 Tax=Rhincodon typus TaxID=259920 RepID=UPI00202F3F29|nr:cilia- and flagella-associated protein 100-like [Rhincodon typus]